MERAPAVAQYARKDPLSATPKAAVQAVVWGIAAEEGRNGVRAKCVGVGTRTGIGHEPQTTLIDSLDVAPRRHKAVVSAFECA